MVVPTTDAPELPPWLETRQGFVTLKVAVRPGVSRQKVMRTGGPELVIALNSPPERGRANDELVAFLAKISDVARSDVQIVHGRSGRHKTVRIAAGNPAALASHLAGELH